MAAGCSNTETTAAAISADVPAGAPSSGGGANGGGHCAVAAGNDGGGDWRDNNTLFKAMLSIDGMARVLGARLDGSRPRDEGNGFATEGTPAATYRGSSVRPIAVVAGAEGTPRWAAGGGTSRCDGNMVRASLPGSNNHSSRLANTSGGT